jgi:hypothetical protein
MLARLTVLLAVHTALASCDAQSQFTQGRDLDVCQSNIPTACILSAGCVLDDNHYLAGKFPSSRRFAVHTGGDETIRFGLAFTEEKAAGSELVITVHEPGCGDRVEWDNGGSDIFHMADSSGVLIIPLKVRAPGDHLVELVSDAYCGYALKLNP